MMLNIITRKLRKLKLTLGCRRRKLEELGPTNGWGFELSQNIPDEIVKL